MKLFAQFLLSAMTLFAADFWQAKRFTEWSTKEAQRVLTSSPWTRQATLTIGPASGGSHSGDRRGASIYDNPTIMRPPDQGQDAAGGAPKQQGGNSGDDDRQPATAPVKLTVQWRSALPVKQALARAKFGAEAATWPEARQLLESYEPAYVVAVLGIAKSLLPGAGTVKQSLTDRTTLTMGGTATPPSDIQFRTSAGGVDAFFVFPRTPIAPATKEAEFSIKLAPLNLKERFRLAEMVFKGKLEM